MAHKNFNRMRETATAPGTGSFTLNGAVQGGQTFVARLASTNRAWYAATNGTAWEVGYGTFTSPATLARTDILESSNGDAVVNFASGNVDIFCDIPASVLDALNLIEEVVASAATCNIGAAQAAFIELTGTTGITSFDTAATAKNKSRRVRYTGAGLTITNSATVVCPGAVNLVLKTGDRFDVKSDNSATPVWTIYNLNRALRPAFSVHRNAVDQTGIVTATFTKLQFTTEEFDVGSCFDNATNYRFTPTVPGKYLITLTATMGNVTAAAFMIASIFKNGTRYKDCLTPPFGGTQDGGASVSAVIDFNGSTDYVEGFVYHTAGSNKTAYGAASLTHMTGSFLS